MGLKEIESQSIDCSYLALNRHKRRTRVILWQSFIFHKVVQRTSGLAEELLSSQSALLREHKRHLIRLSSYNHRNLRHTHVPAKRRGSSHDITLYFRGFLIWYTRISMQHRKIGHKSLSSKTHHLAILALSISTYLAQKVTAESMPSTEWVTRLCNDTSNLRLDSLWRLDVTNNEAKYSATNSSKHYPHLMSPQCLRECDFDLLV
jgi:hypothetical protein